MQRRFWPTWPTSGADVLELDHQVDMATACRTLVGPERPSGGNLDPVGLLVQSSPEKVRETTVGLVRTVKASGTAGRSC